MRTPLLLFLLVYISGDCLAQTQFTRVFGGNSYDFGAEVIQTADEGYLVAGQSSSFTTDLSSQVLLMKIDSDGYSQWRKTIGDEFADKAESMVEDSSGDFFISGFTETVENSYQALGIKIDATGDTIWTLKTGGSSWDLIKQSIALADGSFMMFGKTYSYGNGDGDFYLVKVSADGQELWYKAYGGEADESGESISLANDGGFFLAGTTESFGAGGVDMYVVRTNSDGDTLWTKTYGGVEDDFCYSVAATADGGYVLGGGTYNETPGVMDVVLRKEDGSTQWVQGETHGGDSYISDVIIEPGTQNVTAVGNVVGGTFGGVDGRILRYGADGVWNGVAKTHGSAEDDVYWDVKLTSDNGYIILGSTKGYLNRFDDLWMIKTNNQGQTVQPELGVDNLEIDGIVYRTGCVPNPVSAQTRFYVEGIDKLLQRKNNPVVLRVFDGLGRQLLENQVTSEFTELDVGRLKLGTYYYHLSSGMEVLATGKLVKVTP